LERIMVYQERNLWSSLVVSVIGLVVYVIVTLQAAAGGSLADVDWVPIMLWTICGSIVGAIVVSIVWGIAAGMQDPDGVGASDQRDRDIARFGNRIGYAFLVAAGLVVLVLCAFEADWFWIANTMFFGFAISTIAGGIVSVIAYRRGLV
jgi:hypothetical protein